MTVKELRKYLNELDPEFDNARIARVDDDGYYVDDCSAYINHIRLIPRRKKVYVLLVR